MSEKQVVKKVLFVLIGLFIVSCNHTGNPKIELTENNIESNKGENSASENFDWLIGNWKRLDGNTEKKTFENWSKETPTKYLGHGFVMKGRDTIWQEKITLSKKDSIWVLAVKTPGNNDLIQFKLTAKDSNALTVENSKHDFPKLIKYWRTKDNLNALVSAGKQVLNFKFERTE